MARIGWRYATLWMTVVVVLPSGFLACGGGDEEGQVLLTDLAGTQWFESVMPTRRLLPTTIMSPVD